MKLITLTTDFGFSEYVAAMKGVILSINPEAVIVDITHSIKPFNIKQAAYVLFSALPHFPRAIHVAVVDPGVGTDRKGIIAESSHGYLVGPDNGIFSLLNPERVWEIEFEHASATFHGRDVFAPVAAKLSLGIKPDEMGKPLSKIHEVEVFWHRRVDTGIEGEVIHVDSFGNVITSIKNEVLKARHGERYEVMHRGKKLRMRFLKSYGYAEPGEVILVEGSSGAVEIARNQGNASQHLNIRVGERIVVKPCEGC